MTTNKRDSPPGPKPDAVKIEGDWEEAMGKAMKKPRPKDGWPDETVKAE